MSYRKISSYCDDALGNIRDVIEEMHEAKMAMTHISKLEDCKDIIRTIEAHASDMHDDMEEYEDKIRNYENRDYDEPEGEDVSFQGMGQITAYASNFKDRELMESLAKCFERNIAPQKIIDVLDNLS